MASFVIRNPSLLQIVLYYVLALYKFRRFYLFTYSSAISKLYPSGRECTYISAVLFVRRYIMARWSFYIASYHTQRSRDQIHS